MAMYIVPRFGMSLFDDSMDMDIMDLFRQPLRCRRYRKPCCWGKRTNIRGFKPEEINISKEKNKVTVLAKHVDGDNYTEVKQNYSIPEDVDLDSIKPVVKEGLLHLIGKYQSRERTIPVHSEESTRGQDSVEIITEKSPKSTDISGSNEEDESNAEELKQDEPLDKDYKLTYNVPGFKPEDIDVQLDDNRLSVTGETREEGEGHFCHKKFSKVIHLPDGIDHEKLKCTLEKDGYLQITAPNSKNVEHEQ